MNWFPFFLLPTSEHDSNTWKRTRPNVLFPVSLPKLHFSRQGQSELQEHLFIVSNTSVLTVWMGLQPVPWKDWPSLQWHLNLCSRLKTTQGGLLDPLGHSWIPNQPSWHTNAALGSCSWLDFGICFLGVPNFWSSFTSTEQAISVKWNIV